MVKFTLIFFSTVCLLFGVLFLSVGIFYENVDYAGRIFLCVLGIVCFVLAMIYPIATISLVRIYPKHRKLTALFIQEDVFK